MKIITGLMNQAYSCFEGKDARKFFQAAEFLRLEENISRELIVDIVHQNSQKFKYSQTIGVTVLNVTFPKVDDKTIVLNT